MEYTISLVGNPNVGKTSLYNRITRSLEHVGNWHGVTVAEVSKKVEWRDHSVRMVDLPGLYSLTVYSPEEAISRDNILSGANDIIVNVCEVNNLSRNLYLTLQLLECGVPVVLVVNMMDELYKRGEELDCGKLEKALHIPVIPMSAKYRTDVKLLMDTCLSHLQEKDKRIASLPYTDKLPLMRVSEIIGKNAAAAGFDSKWAAIKVLENDGYVLSALQPDSRQKALIAALGDMQADVARVRYEFIDSITQELIVPATNAARKRKEKKHIAFDKQPAYKLSGIDKLVLNKYLALPVFLLIMALIFVGTFGFLGGFLTDLFQKGIDRLLYRPLYDWLYGMQCPAWVLGLVTDGIVRGVGGMLAFLPQIVLLFFFLALLEDSGYISRVAFMTDGIFRKIGLSGRSVFTLLMGFGCSATAVLTARGLEDDIMRKKTVLLTPFMSCSARLPVYSTIAAAFFAAGKPLVIFALYLLGVCVAFILAAVFEKCIGPLKSGQQSFIMEMPPYRFPTPERVAQIIVHNIKVFLIRVGTVIFALNVIIWLLSNFSLTVGYTAGTNAKSLLETTGQILAPLFRPLGFGNWKAVTSLIGGLVAKEAVITSIESMGGAASIFGGAYPALSAFSFMVFTLLYVPCVATLGAVKKEIGLKWMLLALCLQIGVAYTVSFIFYTVGLFFCMHKGTAIGCCLAAVVFAFCLFVILRLRKGRLKCADTCGKCGQRNCPAKPKKTE